MKTCNFIKIIAVALFPIIANATVGELQQLLPPTGKVGVFFLTRPEVNDTQFTYSLSDKLAFDLHGIRNHWPAETELYYALAQFNTRILHYYSDQNQFNIYALTGIGMANKLKGLNRVAYLAGAESNYETKFNYFSLGATTIGARDYDQKNFIQARAGLYPYQADFNSLRTLILMHALYENHAAHPIEWGPVLHLQYKNMFTEFFGTFKGVFSFSWAFYY